MASVGYMEVGLANVAQILGQSPAKRNNANGLESQDARPVLTNSKDCRNNGKCFS